MGWGVEGLLLRRRGVGGRELAGLCLLKPDSPRTLATVGNGRAVNLLSVLLWVGLPLGQHPRGVGLLRVRVVHPRPLVVVLLPITGHLHCY